MTADAKHYYAAYDILKVSNSVNLFVLVDQILEEKGKGPLDQVNEKEFRAIQFEIYQRINLMGRWTSVSAWGKEMQDDLLLMRRYG